MTLAPAVEQRALSPIRTSALLSGWRLLSVLVLSAFFWLLAWYGDTLRSMVETWVQSETFAHGFLIVPISAWMIWRRRHAIMALTPQPNFWMLLPLIMVGFAWLLAYLASVVVVRQYCLVLMILFLVATILGNKIVKELAFPLLFLLFAVPFGEFLLPTLMESTADFAVFALRLTGIPVYREGLFFTLPSGNWSVIEACSGLRYLIASVTLGCLYAYLTYRSLVRRIVFVALSIVVPIVANWLRAYMIVMVGHLSSMQLAVGVDHLIYGWLFFGIVMLLLFWMGSFWREDEDLPHGMLNAESREPIAKPAWMAILVATLASAAVVTASPMVASHLENVRRMQPMLQIPSGLDGWQLDTARLSDWTPYFLNPSARIRQVYAKDARRIELYIGYYRNQRQSANLISSQNSLVHSGDKVWGNIGDMRRMLNVNGGEIALVETKLKSHAGRLLVWHWYWIDGQYTTNPYWAKLLQAKSQLLGRGDDGAVIILSTEFDEKIDAPGDGLRDFVKGMLPAIAKSLQNAG